jgi:hypothetical protein
MVVSAHRAPCLAARNQAPDVDKRLGGTFGPFEGSRKPAELRVWQGCLDCGKQHTLLVANVLLEPLAQLVHICEGRRLAGVELGCPPPEINMVDENLHYRRVVDRPVASVGGQQQLLLNAKMLAALRLPELDKGPSGIGGGGGRGTPQSERHEQPLMVPA